MIVRKFFMTTTVVGGMLLALAFGFAQQPARSIRGQESRLLTTQGGTIAITNDAYTTTSDLIVDSNPVVVDSNRERHAMEYDVRRLISQLRDTKEESAKRELTERLKATVDSQFDAQQKAREAQLKNLEERVTRLRAEHERRAAAKATIVEKRLQHLFDEVEGLGWTDTPSEGWSPDAPGVSFHWSGGADAAASVPVAVPKRDNADKR